MTKPLVFLSHISEEAELAGLFKAEIERAFLGMIDVFVSSDTSSISVGKNWLDRITEGLRSAEAILILCSPVSIARPWINFEAGAGWARGIAVAPLCHSGLRPVQLPLPLNLLQGIEAHDEAKRGGLFAMLAGKLSSATPTIDAKAFAKRVLEFENGYSLEIRAAPHLKAIQSIWPELVPAIRNSGGQTNNVQGAPDWKVTTIRSSLEALKKEKFLDYDYSVTTMMFGDTGGGISGNLAIAPATTLVQIAGKLFQ
jgi:TIR domain